MEGEVLWEHQVPVFSDASPSLGMDIEVHGDCEQAVGRVAAQVVIPGQGVLIVDRAGQTLGWLEDQGVQHDADRLFNGNTLYTVTTKPGSEGPQVKEVSSEGEPVWEWSASAHLPAIHSCPHI